MTIQFDRQKFKDVVHYVCSLCASNELGAVKLNKVLYYSDMLAFAFFAQPVTGATYRKRAWGPTTDHLLVALRDLAKEGRLEIRDALYFGYRKKEYISHGEPDESRLNPAEKALISDVVEFVCRNNSAKTISELSHDRAWDLADFGAPIPYHSVFHMFHSQLSDDVLKWGAGEGATVEAARSENGAVERRSFSAFRDRVLQAR